MPFIIVEVSDRDSAVPGFCDTLEALFNFGIGAPESDGEEWMHMRGYAYSVESIVVSDVRPELHGRDQIVVH